jgi:hypothetical protein
MKNFIKNFLLFILLSFSVFSCIESQQKNKTALQEQNQTEENQTQLNTVQPAPRINWSLERDNLINRAKLQNDRNVTFFMYIFIEGIADPIGYYQVNKVSSVNSQLTNTEQIVSVWAHNGVTGQGHSYDAVLPSPAEDGSYGTNGDAIFGFTPDKVYLETNMKYLTSTVPLTFSKPTNRLAVITMEVQKYLDVSLKAMEAK